MMDSPQTLYIDYERLSEERTIAEKQKDLLSEVLKQFWQKQTVLVEQKSNSSKMGAPYSRWKITCAQCPLPKNFDAKILSSSLKQIKTGETPNIEIKFDIENQDGEKLKWLIFLVENKKIYYISAKNFIKNDETIEDSNIDIVSCFSLERNCSIKEPYSDISSAKKALANYLNKKVNHSLYPGDQLQKQSLSKELVVKRGDDIKLKYALSPALTITSYAKALDNAGLAEKIRVQIKAGFGSQSSSLSSNIIEATVTAPGEATYEN